MCLNFDFDILCKLLFVNLYFFFNIVDRGIVFCFNERLSCGVLISELFLRIK